MKKSILIAWAGLHIIFIIISNIVDSYSTYYSFYNKKPSQFYNKVLNIMTGNPVAICYGKYTGAETGYGFFGFNVRSNGLFIGECNNKKLTPDFRNSESSLRFFSLASEATNSLLKENKDTVVANPNIMDKYYDLVIRNIAVKLYNSNNCTDSSMLISYNLIDYPSLAEYRKNKKRGYKLIKLKLMKINFR